MKNSRILEIPPMEFVRYLNKIEELYESSSPIANTDLDFRNSRMLSILWSDKNQFSAVTPTAIIGNKNTLSDLIPRIVALPSFSLPLTGRIKAWHMEDFIAGANLETAPLSNSATLGFIGLMIAELKATIGAEVDLKIMGMDSVRRTLSFVCAQAVARGWDYKNLQTITSRWIETRQLTDNEESPPIPSYINEYSGFLQNLESKLAPKDIRERLANDVASWVCRNENQNYKNNFSILVSGVTKEIKSLKSRDSRYDVVTHTINRFNNFEETLNPLLHGFLLSLIEPGSFDFFELAQRSGHNPTPITIAYCMFTSILGGEGSLGKFGGFGWNIAKNSNNFESEFSTDISLSELRVLHHSQRSIPIAFRTRSPSLIDVELAPYISGSFGNPARRRLASKADDPMPDIDYEALRENINSALNSLELAKHTLQSKKVKSTKIFI